MNSVAVRLNVSVHDLNKGFYLMIVNLMSKPQNILQDATKNKITKEVFFFKHIGQLYEAAINN